MLPDDVRADLDRYVDLLRERFGEDLVSVVLFGSWVAGRARPDSDLDLLVVVRGLPAGRLARRTEFVRLVRSISPEFAERVSHVLLAPEEAARVKPYYLGLLDAHRMLFDRDGFFAGVLARLRARLAELGARKLIDDDGFEYWDLKPDWKPGDVVSL